MRPSKSVALVQPYHKWVVQHIENGYTGQWIADQLGVSLTIFRNYLYTYQRRTGHRIVRKRQLHNCLHPEHPILDTEFDTLRETEGNTPPCAEESLSLHGRVYRYPTQWDELSFSQLAALWECATASNSVTLFLLNAAQILFDITIRELRHSEKCVPQFNEGSTYLISPLEERGINTYDVVTFPELYNFIEAVKWLLDKDGTHIESHRTLLPTDIDIAIDRMIAIPSAFEALTFEEFLLIEDLRLSGAPLSQLLSIIYVPTNPPRRGETERRRVPFDARDFKQIERTIKNLINDNVYKHACSGVWWWWWEGNLRQYAETFPRLFTLKNPDGKTQEPILDKTSVLPSRLMYYLADGDFTKLKDIRQTNIIDAFRLLETHVEEAHEHANTL